MANGEVRIEFKAEGAPQVASQIDGLAAKFSGLGSSVSAGFRGVGSAISGVLGVAGKIAGLASAVAGLGGSLLSFKGITSAFDWGADIVRQSAAIGASAKDVMLLGQAFKENGASAVNMEAMIAKLQRKIAEGSEGFKNLGISVESIKGKGALEQIRAIGDAVRKVSSQEDRARGLMQVFEEQGPQLMQFFNNPDALEGAAKTLGSSVDIMSRNAAAFERASTLLSNIGIKFKSFFAGVAEGVVTPLNKLMEAFNAYDLAAVGREFGESLEYGIELITRAFQQDKLGKLISLSFDLGAAVLKDGIVAVGEKLLEFAKKVGGVIWDAIVDKGTRLGDEFGDYIGGALIGLTDGPKAAIAAIKTQRDARARQDARIGIKQEDSETAKALARITAFGKLDLGMGNWKPSREKPEEAPIMNGGVTPPKVDLPKLSGGNSIAADSLARVGGYLGGVQSPQVLASRQTAKNTAETNKILRRISRTPAAAVFA